MADGGMTVRGDEFAGRHEMVFLEFADEMRGLLEL